MISPAHPLAQETTLNQLIFSKNDFAGAPLRKIHWRTLNDLTAVRNLMAHIHQQLP
jgi:hypothetical protein